MWRRSVTGPVTAAATCPRGWTSSPLRRDGPLAAWRPQPQARSQSPPRWTLVLAPQWLVTARTFTRRLVHSELLKIAVGVHGASPSAASTRRIVAVCPYGWAPATTAARRPRTVRGDDGGGGRSHRLEDVRPIGSVGTRRRLGGGGARTDPSPRYGDGKRMGHNGAHSFPFASLLVGHIDSSWRVDRWTEHVRHRVIRRNDRHRPARRHRTCGPCRTRCPPIPCQLTCHAASRR